MISRYRRIQSLARRAISARTTDSLGGVFRWKSTTVPLQEEEEGKNAPSSLGNSHHHHKNTALTNKKIDFDDSKAAYESKTTLELVRALMVFQLCRIPVIVKHSERLLDWSRKILGTTMTDSILKATFFGHFVAGTNEETIRPQLSNLQNNGIGSILDYAHEDDGEQQGQGGDDNKKTSDVENNHHGEGSFQKHTEQASLFVTHNNSNTIQEQVHQARTYDYESERQCDKHVGTFKKCINAVQDLDADGYAAIKVTALGPPKLLEKMSTALREIKILFSKFDTDGDGYISPEEFQRGYDEFFLPSQEAGSDDHLQEMFELLMEKEDGDTSSTAAAAGSRGVDFITWSMMIRPEDLPRITSQCRSVGPLALATPTWEEVQLMRSMFNRGRELAEEATKCGTRLLIDAEQYRFQPAIDNLVLDLQRNFNTTTQTDKPIIYNTYQCYLKDTDERLRTDMERSKRHSYHFGAKLVRGAYMEGERSLAESMGYESPIHDTIEDTHACYDDSVDYMLRQATAAEASSSDDNNRRVVEMMLASHNQSSIEKAIEIMGQLDINPQASTICFAQLYGMTDNLTYNLGQNNFRAYKYVPYGEVGEVMPYLIRRAKENSAITGGAAKELQMIQAELLRRMQQRLVLKN